MLDEGESSEVDIQDEIEFALLQMKAETLNKIDLRSADSEKAPTVSVSSAGTTLLSAPSGPSVRGEVQGL